MITTIRDHDQFGTSPTTTDRLKWGWIDVMALRRACLQGNSDADGDDYVPRALVAVAAFHHGKFGELAAI